MEKQHNAILSVFLDIPRWVLLFSALLVCSRLLLSCMIVRETGASTNDGSTFLSPLCRQLRDLEQKNRQEGY